MNPSKIKKFLDVAYAVALSSSGVGGRSHCNFRIGAVLTDGPVILSARANSYKTNPNLVDFYKYPHLHAEANCILDVGVSNCKGLKLYVVRILRNGRLALAKPCLECTNFIDHAKIKQVIYSTGEGYEVSCR